MKHLAIKLTVVFIIVGACFLYNPIKTVPNPDDDAGPRYCFAFWAPHGGFWQDVCYDSMRQCRAGLAARLAVSDDVNTKSCYRLEYTVAYCIGDVLTGRTRQDDAYHREYEIMTEICTRTERQCIKFAKYRDAAHAADRPVCERAIVKTGQGEGRYLSTRAQLDEIVKNNAHRTQEKAQ